LEIAMQRSTPFSPNTLLRLESLALLAGAVALYARIAPDWGLFALLLFAPDISMIGYLRDERTGSLVYNLGHLLALPLGLAAFGIAFGAAPAVQIALIWVAHIALDRVLGYGLKYPTHFKDTHMQHV
jgi:hypothetical protein